MTGASEQRASHTWNRARTMAEVHRLPDTDEAEREASEWIARLHADDVSNEDRARFEAWRSAHPRYARAYEELSATWRRFTEAGRLVRAVSFGQSMNEAATPRPAHRRWVLATAASLAAIALAGVWWAVQLRPETLFQTAVGEHASVQLPDGSTLDLNSNSLARVEYTERARVLRLEHGEGYFVVQHDVNRPFWVVAGGSWVRAVGTAFNVYVRPSGVRVTVSEGTVKVAAAQSRDEAPSDGQLANAPVSVLTAGQQVDMRGQATEVRSLAPAEITRIVAWRKGTLYFENEPLGEVVNEISRYTTLQIVVDDDALRGLPVGGTFQANPQGAEALLTMLEDGFGLEVRREGSGRALVVSAQGAESDR